jgi:hypothetical protein
MSQVTCPEPGSQMTIGSVTFAPATPRWLAYNTLTEKLLQWEAHGRCLLAAHRGQLPSEAADLYGGGCGCPQCADVLALLKGPNDLAKPPGAALCDRSA